MVRSEKFTFSSSIDGEDLCSIIETALEDHDEIRKWEVSSKSRTKRNDVIYSVRVPDFTDSRRISRELKEEIERNDEGSVNISI